MTTTLDRTEAGWAIIQRIADARQISRAATPAQYLEEFRGEFQRLLETLETDTTNDLEGRGPSEDLLHSWSLFVAQGQDFLADLAAEIERVGG